MQGKGIINLSHFNSFNIFLKENRKLIIFIALFFIGFIFGIYIFCKVDYFSEVFNFLKERFTSFRENESFFKITINSLFASMSLLIFAFSCGVSMMGLLLIPIGVLTHGLTLGIFASGLYSAYSFEGVAYFAVLIVPAAVLSTISFILSAIEAFDFSLNLTKTISFGNKSDYLSTNFKLFCLKQVLFFVLILIAALIDGLISCNLLTNFNLS